jgi:hypothetical protein
MYTERENVLLFIYFEKNLYGLVTDRRQMPAERRMDRLGSSEAIKRNAIVTTTTSTTASRCKESIRKKDLSGRRDDGESIIPIRSDRDELLLLL